MLFGVFLPGGFFLPCFLSAQPAPRKAPVAISLRAVSAQWAGALPESFQKIPQLQKITPLIVSMLEKEHTPARLLDLRSENLNEYRKIISRAEFEALEIERKSAQESESVPWSDSQKIQSQKIIEETAGRAGFSSLGRAREEGVFGSRRSSPRGEERPEPWEEFLEMSPGEMQEGWFFQHGDTKEDDSREGSKKNPIGFAPAGAPSQAEKTLESSLGETGKKVDKIRDWVLRFTETEPEEAKDYLYKARELFRPGAGFGAEGKVEPSLEGARAPEEPMGFQASRKRYSGPFYRDSANDSKEAAQKLKDPQKGLHYFYRLTALPMRRRFIQLLKSPMPMVFLHGDVHVENYVRMNMGATLTDLDQAVFGPYGFDISRFLGSLALFMNKRELPKEVLSAFSRGYLEAQSPENPFRQMKELQDVKQKEEEKTVASYVKAGGSRVKNMRENPLPPDDPQVRELMETYLERGSPLNGRYTIVEAGYTDNLGMSSIGRRRYFVLLRPQFVRAEPADLEEKSAEEILDQVLLEFKPIDRLASDVHYMDVFRYPTARVLVALKLYAPKMEYALGTSSLKNQDYWVRGVQPQRVKPDFPLSLDPARSLALAVGSQLGRAHGLSWLGAERIIERFPKDLDEIVRISYQMLGEIEQSYQFYLKENRQSSEM